MRGKCSYGPAGLLGFDSRCEIAKSLISDVFTNLVQLRGGQTGSHLDKVSPSTHYDPLTALKVRDFRASPEKRIKATIRKS